MSTETRARNRGYRGLALLAAVCTLIGWGRTAQAVTPTQPILSVSGTTFASGSTVTYTVQLGVTGASQPNNSGHEFTITLPAEVTLVSATANSGTAATSGNDVNWDGAITSGAGFPVTITITATVTSSGQNVCAQGTFNYDSGDTGTNDASVSTNSPTAVGQTCFQQPLAVSPLTPTMNVSATSTTATYTVQLGVNNPNKQVDNPGHEFTVALPACLTVTAVTATSGTGTFSGSSAFWDGEVPVGFNTVTITITATIGSCSTSNCAQGFFLYDTDGNGTNDGSQGTVTTGFPGGPNTCFSISSKIGTLTARPAATLLLPYFEVNLGNPNGSSTTFTVGNATKTPGLAHVTLWTDLGIPTTSFDLFLGGFDIQEVDLRLLFASGILPNTSPLLGNAGSNSGNYSAPHGALLASCVTTGLGTYPRLSDAALTALRASHTGLVSGGKCLGAAKGDNIARGYVTVDSVSQCSDSLTNAKTPGYFVNGGTGIANDNNILFGHYTFVDRLNKFAGGDAMAAIFASTNDPATLSGSYTFYSRHIGDSRDNRAGIPSDWEGRYLNGTLFTGGTDLFVWRDAGARVPFTCGAPPAGLRVTRAFAFDEQEHPYDIISGFQPLPPNPPNPAYDLFLPLAAQRVNALSLGVPFQFGFLYLALRDNVGAVNQAHVTLMHSSPGRYAAVLPAWPVGTLTAPAGFVGY